MSKILAGLIGLTVLMLTQSDLHGQAIFEYGKGLDGIGQRQRTINPKGFERSHERRRSGPVEHRGESGDPATSAPSMLSVKEKEAYLYARQDRHSTVVAKVNQGEKLATLAQSFEKDGIWFMVKAPNGAMGWVSSSDVGTIDEQKK